MGAGRLRQRPPTHPSARQHRLSASTRQCTPVPAMDTSARQNAPPNGMHT
ncbi:hypothetical protein N9L68_07770 [bacterium]|nr:hypothetical protein [bacterium]